MSKDYSVDELKAKGIHAGRQIMPFAGIMLRIFEKKSLIDVNKIAKTTKIEPNLIWVILTVHLAAFYFIYLDYIVHGLFRPAEYRAIMDAASLELVKEVRAWEVKGNDDKKSLGKMLAKNIKRWKKSRDLATGKRSEERDPVIDEFGELLFSEFGFKKDITAFLHERDLGIHNAFLSQMDLAKDFQSFIKGLQGKN